MQSGGEPKDDDDDDDGGVGGTFPYEEEGVGVASCLVWTQVPDFGPGWDWGLECRLKARAERDPIRFNLVRL